MEYSQASPELSPDSLYALFEHCNHSELYQIAREGGHVVLPSMGREALIRVITGADRAPPLHEHVVDEYRRAIMAFVIDHRKSLETQIKCPARSFQPDACFGCLDQQVYSCLTSTPEQQRLIQLYKRKLPQGDPCLMSEETTAAPLDVLTAPRSLHVLNEQTSHTLRQLAYSLGFLIPAENMVAWHRAPTHGARAQIVLDCLAEWDKANPGQYQGVPVTTGPQPAQQPEQPQMQQPQYAQQPQFAQPTTEATAPMNQPPPFAPQQPQYPQQPQGFAPQQPQQFAPQGPPQQQAPQGYVPPPQQFAPQQPPQGFAGQPPPPPQFAAQAQPYPQQQAPQPQYAPPPAPPQQFAPQQPQYAPPGPQLVPPPPPNGQGVYGYGGGAFAGAPQAPQNGVAGGFVPPAIVPPQQPIPQGPPQQPLFQPQQGAPQPAAVNPAAQGFAAGAAAAEAPKATRGRRSPTAPTAGAAPSDAGLGNDVLTLLSGLRDSNAALHARLDRSEQLLQWTLSLLLIQGTNPSVPGSAVQLMKTTIDSAGMLDQLIAQATGKG